MNVGFEKVSRFKDVDLPLPQRGTAGSAGYDFVVAEDIVLPPYEFLAAKVRDKVLESDPNLDYFGFTKPFTLASIADLNKSLKTKLPLVSTGMKCAMPKGVYLELSVRSSTPLKHWIVLANSVGIIDSDYYNNPDNEGEIFFQVINLAPFAIELKRGDKIGQGIFHSYHMTDDDNATALREGGFGSTNMTPLYPLGTPGLPIVNISDWPPAPAITCTGDKIADAPISTTSDGNTYE